MIRAFGGWSLGLCCWFSAAAAWAQFPIYPAYPQPPAWSAYSQYGPLYGGVSPYGYGGFGYGNFGNGGYGFSPYGYGWGYPGFGYRGLGFGGFGYGGVGSYPLNSFGNTNLLPPNRPSPYYVTPSGDEYLEWTRRRDQATYSEILLRASQ